MLAELAHRDAGLVFAEGTLMAVRRRTSNRHKMQLVWAQSSVQHVKLHGLLSAGKAAKSGVKVEQKIVSLGSGAAWYRAG